MMYVDSKVNESTPFPNQRSVTWGINFVKIIISLLCCVLNLHYSLVEIWLFININDRPILSSSKFQHNTRWPTPHLAVFYSSVINLPPHSNQQMSPLKLSSPSISTWHGYFLLFSELSHSWFLETTLKCKLRWTKIMFIHFNNWNCHPIHPKAKFCLGFHLFYVTSIYVKFFYSSSPRQVGIPTPKRSIDSCFGFHWCLGGRLTFVQGYEFVTD